jgi:carbonic anhydrase
MVKVAKQGLSNICSFISRNLGTNSEKLPRAKGAEFSRDYNFAAQKLKIRSKNNFLTGAARLCYYAPKNFSFQRRFGVRRIYLLVLLLIFLLSSSIPATAAVTSEVSPEAALKMLQEGNGRFVCSGPKRLNQNANRRVQTAEKGQHPFAVVLACADSRVPVEVLFDRGIGDIFVVRDAGNIATTTDIGSIEYAVDHLGSPLVVVLGHSKCGAVTAAVEGGEAPPNIKAIVDFIAPAVAIAKNAAPDKCGEALVPAAITANVWQSMSDIYKNSPMMREKVKGGKVKMLGATYDIKSGKVNWMGPHPQQAQLVAEEAK